MRNAMSTQDTGEHGADAQRGAAGNAVAADPAASGRGQSLDSLAPLTPNAWLRYDVVRRLIPPGVHDILEVGCGQGSVGARLAARYRYLGLEPDPQSYAVAARRVALAGRGGEVRNAAFEELGPEERFDMVCAFEVLEHIEDDKGALKEWSGRLRPGGWILLSVPAHQHRFAAADEAAGHFRRYDQEPMRALLSAAGFSDIEIREYGMPLGFLLEAGRNRILGRRMSQSSSASMEARTGGSGRLLQPRGGVQGAVTRWGTFPFRYAQRGFPNTGTGIVVRARLAA
jgi:SAM-dependent methyltransferase